MCGRESRKRGAVIVLAVIFMLFCFLAGGAYVFVVNNESDLMKKEIDAIRALYQAECGLQYGLFKVKKDTP